MNPGYNPINYQTIQDNAKLLHVPVTVFRSEIFDIVAKEEDSPCYLCARMRRGYLYSKAKELIRPLYLIRETDIIRWAEYNGLHFIQCACRFTENCASCGGTEKGSKRAEIKELIRELSRKSPFIEKNIFRSVENVNLNTVIAYKQNGVKHHFLDTYEENGGGDD